MIDEVPRGFGATFDHGSDYFLFLNLSIKTVLKF